MRPHLSGRARPLLLIPAARLALVACDPAMGLALTREGLATGSPTLPEQVHLHAIRAACLLASNARADLVSAASTDACVLAGATQSLLPFAMLPANLRHRLVETHRADHSGTWIIADAEDRGVFRELTYDIATPKPLIRLTRIEEELLPFLCTSQTLEAVAHRLNVSANTLRNQAAGLRAKLGARDRRELALKAGELGLVDPVPTNPSPGGGGA